METERKEQNIMSQDYWLQSFINENNIRDDCWRGEERQAAS